MSNDPSGVIQKYVRVVGALVALALVVFYAAGAVARYRAGDAPAQGASAEATPTPAPEGSDGGGEGSQDSPASSEGEGDAAEEQVAEEESPASATVVVKVDGLNFRTEPDKNADVIRGLDAGERLELIKTEGGWHYAEDGDGERGWLYASEQYSRVEE